MTRPRLVSIARRRADRRYPPLAVEISLRCTFVIRQCSRPGCAEHATATFTYQYARSVVWLDDLSRDRDPHGYDLCERHSSRLGVPHGWRLDDRRERHHLQLLAG